MLKYINYLFTKLFRYFFKKKEQLEIFDVLRFLEHGYVAMDKDGIWYWFREEPIRKTTCWMPYYNYLDYMSIVEYKNISSKWNIKKFSNWKRSLLKVK